MQNLQDRRQTLEVVTADQLTHHDLLPLFRGNVLAVRVPGFYPADLCNTVSGRLIQHHRFGYYETEDGAGQIGRWGMALYETGGRPDRRPRYFDQAAQAIRDFRRLCHPWLSPIDRLRLELDELWSAGTGLENLDGRPLFVGLARVFEEGAEALPHQDVLHWDWDCPRARSLRTQLAANVYLQPSPEGGELELWDRHFPAPEFEALRLPGSYGLDRQRLPEPAARLTPQTGELILFVARRLHAVRPARGGLRVTQSCFIGFRGEDQPLKLWS